MTPTPYFENDVIQKNSFNDTGEPHPTPPLSMKAGKDLTKKSSTPSKGGKKRNHEEQESFFVWFQ